MTKEGNIIAVHSLSELFTALSNHWNSLRDHASELGKDILDALPAETSEKKLPDFLTAQQALADAVKTLQNRLSHPELTLALTGTTSSGKSTLGNLLIGEEILPQAVQEMSAGIVRVVHSDTERSLEIVKTKGATWATGQWKDISPTAIRNRLEETMEKFREAEKHDPSLEPVRFEVRWPTYIGLHPELLSLPPHTKLTILDLPGLKSINDERNGPVIRDNISKALSLVIYNASETDRDKQKELLEDVAAQVKKLNASPDRMLFILNKIDAFAADGDKANISRQKFIDEITKDIRTILAERLNGYSKASERITPLSLSSRPAFLSLKLQQQGNTLSREECIKLATEIDTSFRSLIPRDLSRTFPREMEDMTAEQFTALCKEVFITSGLTNFATRLQDHIKTNLPSLMLKDVIADAKAALQLVLETIASTLTSTEAETEAEVEKKRRALDELFQKIGCEQEKIIAKLASLAEPLEESNFEKGAAILEGRANKLAKETGENTLLNPLSDARDAIVNEPYLYITDNFAKKILSNNAYQLFGSARQLPPTDQDHNVLSEIYTHTQNLSDCQNYYDSLVLLRNSPYGPKWETGGTFREDQNDEANRVRDALEFFTAKLGPVCRDAFLVASKEQGRQIEDVLQRYIAYLITQLEASLTENYGTELHHFPHITEALSGLTINIPPFTPADLSFEASYKKGVVKGFKNVSREETTWLTYLTFGLYTKTVTEKVETQHPAINVVEWKAMCRHLFEKNRFQEALMDTLRHYLGDVLKNFQTMLNERFQDVKTRYQQALQDRLTQLEAGLKEDKDKIALSRQKADQIQQEGTLQFKTDLSDETL